MKIVLDCANGAGYKAAPKLLKDLGAKVIFNWSYKPNGLILMKNVAQLIQIKLKMQLKNLKHM